jgi:hypothetical protein
MHYLYLFLSMIEPTVTFKFNLKNKWIFNAITTVNGALKFPFGFLLLLLLGHEY